MRAAELSLDWLPGRCASTVRYLQPVSGIAVRQHQAVHYASLFRFDDILLANTHAAGVWACHSPVLQLRRTCSAHLFASTCARSNGSGHPRDDPNPAKTHPVTTEQKGNPTMNDPQTRLVDELAAAGVLRRLEFIRARMHAWKFTAGDPGHIDAADPTNIDPDHPMESDDDIPPSPASSPHQRRRP